MTPFGAPDSRQEAAAQKSPKTAGLTLMITWNQRLRLADYYLRGFLTDKTRYILDNGVGFPPLTTLNLADLLAKEFPRIRVAALESSIPSFVIDTGFVLQEARGSRYGLLFNSAGELIAVNSSCKSYTGEEIRKRQRSYYKDIMSMRDRMMRGGKGFGGKCDTILRNPFTLPEYNRPNMKFIQGDIWNVPFKDKSFDVIRDCNLSAIYYTAQEREALFRKYSRLLRENGVLLIGMSGPEQESYEYYELYKKENGRLVAHSAIFNVLPTAVEAFGKHEFFSQGRGIAGAFRSVVEDFSSRIPKEKKRDFFARMTRGRLLRKITAGFKVSTYDVSILNNEEGFPLGVSIRMRDGSINSAAPAKNTPAGGFSLPQVLMAVVLAGLAFALAPLQKLLPLVICFVTGLAACPVINFAQQLDWGGIYNGACALFLGTAALQAAPVDALAASAQAGADAATHGGWKLAGLFGAGVGAGALASILMGACADSDGTSNPLSSKGSKEAGASPEGASPSPLISLEHAWPQ